MKTTLATWIAGLVLAGLAGIVTPLVAQDVRPLTPVLDPPPEQGEEERTPREDPAVVPLPEATSRADAAARTRSRTAVLPTGWTSLAKQYQPYWLSVAPPNAFGIGRWSAWFAGSGLAPRMAPHPFFTPFGILAYEGWIFERYRALWTGVRVEEGGRAAVWLQRGDREMAAGRIERAARAYRRAALERPELPHAHLALAVALAETGDDAAAAKAIRRGVARYAAWLPLEIRWIDLLADENRLSKLLTATARRARASPEPDPRLVAGVIHLFGGRPRAGRALLGELEPDATTRKLLSRGPS